MQSQKIGTYNVFFFDGAAILAKFGSNRRNTLQSPRINLSFVKDVGGWSPQMAPVVCDANSRRLGRFIWLG